MAFSCIILKTMLIQLHLDWQYTFRVRLFFTSERNTALVNLQLGRRSKSSYENQQFVFLSPRSGTFLLIRRQSFWKRTVVGAVNWGGSQICQASVNARSWMSIKHVSFVVWLEQAISQSSRSVSIWVPKLHLGHCYCSLKINSRTKR